MAIFTISFFGDRKKCTIYHLNFSVVIRKIAAFVVKNFGFSNGRFSSMIFLERPCRPFYESLEHWRIDGELRLTDAAGRIAGTDGFIAGVKVDSMVGTNLLLSPAAFAVKFEAVGITRVGQGRYGSQGEKADEQDGR